MKLRGDCILCIKKEDGFVFVWILGRAFMGKGRLKERSLLFRVLCVWVSMLMMGMLMMGMLMLVLQEEKMGGYVVSRGIFRWID
jgi:hypothetical protein